MAMRVWDRGYMYGCDAINDAIRDWCGGDEPTEGFVDSVYESIAHALTYYNLHHMPDTSEIWWDDEEVNEEPQIESWREDVNEWWDVIMSNALEGAHD